METTGIIGIMLGLYTDSRVCVCVCIYIEREREREYVGSHLRKFRAFSAGRASFVACAGLPWQRQAQQVVLINSQAFR